MAKYLSKTVAKCQTCGGERTVYQYDQGKSGSTCRTCRKNHIGQTFRNHQYWTEQEDLILYRMAESCRTSQQSAAWQKGGQGWLIW